MRFLLLEELERNGLIALGRGDIISKEDMAQTPGNYPVYSSSAAENGEFGKYGKYMFDDERITWSIDGGGRLFYRNNHRYSVTNVCGWLKINTDTLTTKYVYYCLYYQWLCMKFDYTYKAHPSVIKKLYKIPLITLDEQSKIVKHLDKIIEIIEKNTSMFVNFNDLIKSRFIEMFGDPVLNTKNYPTQELSSLGYFNRGRSQHRPRNDKILLGGPYPLIQTGDVANADTYINNFAQTYSEEGLKQSKMWRKGTLCITIAANIAKTAILNIDACFPDSIIGFIPHQQVSVLFIHNWFKFFQPILEEQAPSVAQKNLNGTTLGKVRVIVPPIESQMEFENFVRTMDKLKFSVQREIDLYNELFEKKLSEYFG